ncbi:DUF2834 domain-containing protein [Sinimarinibacterium sp. CAU 1509]|uniref:DUF2834 domain-containing protein n=1 Tax=Sinimarinibacterium sp. CAU 1509 TaxID=2562283 RepID=UPI0010ABA1C7|nr:DUF2834 domain-containing protein [Sinimarinibacterium sp. CAU 1509]TJY60021.1 DUF2834 domain-containing protein [Sinimarinibacterium sp. CAU 1509]
MEDLSTQPPGRGVEWLYAGLALVGLFGTGVQVLGYFDAGFIDANLAFWKDTVATPASTFIVVDILVLAAAVFVWMFGECRRLGLSGAWAYFLASVFIGISFAFPLFLAHRQRTLRLRSERGGLPAGADWIALALAVIAALVAAAYSLGHQPG